VKHPVTPDGRYFVVRGRLWRMTNPDLEKAKRADLVGRLIAPVAAHMAVDEVKRALGERGPAWWDDGSPDFNQHIAKNTPYADWYAGLARFDHGGL
jgi:hypothetical protein